MTEAPIRELLIATRNIGKVMEIQQALEGLRLKIRVLEEFPDIAIPEELGESYAENAAVKARAYAAQTLLPALADDSGLEVAALGGSPGVRSARFGELGFSDAERTSLLLSMLSLREMEQRQARFVCVVAVVQPNGSVISIETGICEGKIAKMAMGNQGFGYDPIFIPEGYDMTFAQMPAALKNRISHRAKALAATRQFISTRL